MQTIPGHDPPRWILVVDDDEAVLRSIGRMLSRLGFSVVLVSQVEEAIARFAEPWQFECLFVDLNLQGWSGIDVARAARSAGIDAPIVYVSGADDAPPGAERLLKPFRVTSLVDVLGRLGLLRR